MTSRLALVFLACMIVAPAQITGANGIKKGSWRPKDVPEGYKVYNIGRYEFQSNAPEDRVRIVAKHLNSMYDLYKKTFPAGRTPTKTFVVKIFKDREEFLAYGAPPGAGAYYSWHDKEMVGYDTGKLDGVMTDKGTTGVSDRGRAIMDALKKEHTLDLIGVFAHEGWHQYFHWWCTSKIPFPSWCDEGIGEYFYTARVRDGKTVVGAPNDFRLGTIKYAIRKDQHIPLKELVTYDKAAYYAKAGLCYAEGWSLVHFFLEHPDYKKERYISRFVTTFIDQHSIEKAVAQIFGRMDWEKTEKDWKEWVLALKTQEKSVEELAEEGDLSDLFGEGGELPPPAPPAEGEEKPAGGGK